MATNFTTGEVPLNDLESNFRSMSLRELSFEAAQIAELTSENEPDELTEELQNYLRDATAAKVDGYCLFVDYLKGEIEAWKLKRSALDEMCDRIIFAKEAQLKALKENILRLHAQGLIDYNLKGKDKAIEIRLNSKPTIEVLGNPENLPKQYRTAKWVADKEAIAADHIAGVDVSGFANVSFGKQVRFKNAPRNKKEKKS
ncbi:siphovirus Gp157 family protein [Aphanothece hegewaldii]|uniref:siphovirus Gp157 family protein n=1 Tax=Aphanothece hegewaldii TaxID=1521625 RepID=UPI001FE82A44|nr:siphovirus Gp157 family protein [Aphanothece hegewaldii]